jgi:sugar phosphate isomerase/epimerase
MRLSCLPVSFFSEIISGKMSVYEWANMGAFLKLDGVDLSILFIPNRSLKEATCLRQEIESAGMRVAMLTTYPDFTHPQAAQREKELALEIEAVAIAEELGADLVRVTAGQAHPETEREHGIQWAIEGLNRLCEATKGSTTRLVYENHAKPGVWEHTDFSQPPEIFLEIVRGTAGSGLGVNFDTGNAATFADDPVALLDQVLERVVSVHASDSRQKGKLEHVLLGTGVTPYQEMFTHLKQANWDGWICMEEASFSGIEGVRRAAEFIRRIWSGG